MVKNVDFPLSLQILHFSCVEVSQKAEPSLKKPRKHSGAFKRLVLKIEGKLSNFCDDICT